MAYDRTAAAAYALRWAKGRNPRYADFEALGGDCTNFVSQCLCAGVGKMDYTPDTGWYYTDITNRAAAWSGVDYLYRYLTGQSGSDTRVVFGAETEYTDTRIGDIIQLSFDDIAFTHTLIVTGRRGKNIYVCAHSYDSLNRRLDTYTYKSIRALSVSADSGTSGVTQSARAA